LQYLVTTNDRHMTSARRTSARCEGILEQVFDLPILNDDLTLSHEHEYHLQHQRAESEDQFTSGQKQSFALPCMCCLLVLHTTSPQSVTRPVEYREWKCCRMETVNAAAAEQETIFQIRRILCKRRRLYRMPSLDHQEYSMKTKVLTLDACT